MLATLVIFCCTALPADTSRTAAPAPAVESKTSSDSAVRTESNAAKPDSPMPKTMDASADAESASVSEPSALSVAPISNVAVQPATTEAYETPRKQMFWYGLIAAGHAGAGFDAWTTRRAVSRGYVEADPTERPFAHSNAIYASTQVSPLLMDYVGHRMMRSRYSVFRRFWWVPQTASASLSFGAAAHNYHLVH
jgi:hypothetical protein